MAVNPMELPRRVIHDPENATHADMMALLGGIPQNTAAQHDVNVEYSCRLALLKIVARRAACFTTARSEDKSQVRNKLSESWLLATTNSAGGYDPHARQEPNAEVTQALADFLNSNEADGVDKNLLKHASTAFEYVDQSLCHFDPRVDKLRLWLKVVNMTDRSMVAMPLLKAWQQEAEWAKQHLNELSFEDALDYLTVLCKIAQLAQEKGNPRRNDTFGALIDALTFCPCRLWRLSNALTPEQDALSIRALALVDQIRRAAGSGISDTPEWVTSALASPELLSDPDRCLQLGRFGVLFVRVGLVKNVASALNNWRNAQQLSPQVRSEIGVILTVAGKIDNFQAQQQAELKLRQMANQLFVVWSV